MAVMTIGWGYESVTVSSAIIVHTLRLKQWQSLYDSLAP